MGKDKKIKVDENALQFEDIQITTEQEPEPPRKLEATIEMGTRIILPEDTE